MVCRTCGATIAEKAIVCYRCGTPTATPQDLRSTRPPAPAGPPVWLPILLLVLAVVAAGLALEPAAGPGLRTGEGVAAALLLIGSGYGFWRRR